MDAEKKESEAEEVVEEEVIEDGEEVIEEEVVEEEEYEEVEEEYVEEEVVEEEEGEGTSDNPINIEEPVTTDDDAAATEDGDNADGVDETQEVSSEQGDEEQGDEEQGLIQDGAQTRDIPEKFVAQKREPKSSGQYWIICFLIAASLGGLAGLGYYLTEEENKDRSNPSLASIRPTNPPTIATVSNFDAIQGNCDSYFGLTTPHPYDQCFCTGSIKTIPDDIASRYNYLKSAFVGSLYGDGDWLAKDISECLPENQALIWLSTAENGLFSEAEQQQRFALATLFSATQGMQWSDKGSWMSNSDSCSWYGVECEGTTAAVVSLENNRMKGMVSIFVSIVSKAH
mmetsp:Transcript_18901/g.46824  ORF Transcript_18901/g.46824 Transcript_18901/m.46824 type:complete len:342 (+) Transcript_18901:197-1222(+)